MRNKWITVMARFYMWERDYDKSEKPLLRKANLSISKPRINSRSGQIRFAIRDDDGSVLSAFEFHTDIWEELNEFVKSEMRRLDLDLLGELSDNID